MVTKAKVLKFEPIGDDLSFATSMVQSSNLLDLAAQFAAEVRDYEALTQIAAVYMEMGSRLIVDTGEDEEEPDSDEESKPVGFRPHVIIVEPELLEQETLDE